MAAVWNDQSFVFDSFHDIRVAIDAPKVKTQGSVDHAEGVIVGSVDESGAGDG